MNSVDHIVAPPCCDAAVAVTFGIHVFNTVLLEYGLSLVQYK